MTCKVCSLPKPGISFTHWVKPTFTDHDKLKPGDVICHDCLFWFDERSEELARLVGKDKPQRMRNYSHFIKNGEWMPLSKGNKARMKSLLLNKPFPELAAIADSGQKHIVFRATKNEPGQRCGIIQFEEQSFYLDPAILIATLEPIEALYITFSKTEIETGNYKQHRIIKFGVEAWHELEQLVSRYRGSLLFKLAIFLAQKEESNDATRVRQSSRFAGGDLARDTSGLQKPLPAQHLGSVRESGESGGLHQQAGKVRQLALFASTSDSREDQRRTHSC